MRKTVKVDMKRETTYYALKVMQERYKEYGLTLSEIICSCVQEKWAKLLEAEPELKTKLLILQKTGGRGIKHIEECDDLDK